MLDQPSDFSTYIPDLPAWPTYLTHLPDIPAWPTYLTHLPDIHAWPTYLTYLPDKKTFSTIQTLIRQFHNSCNVFSSPGYDCASSSKKEVPWMGISCISQVQVPWGSLPGNGHLWPAILAAILKDHLDCFISMIFNHVLKLDWAYVDCTNCKL